MSVATNSTSFDREALILGHMPQVRLLAMQFHRRCPSEVLLEDLVSVGTTGLIQAVDCYDPNRNLKLKTLAEHRVRGAIQDYFRQLDPLSRNVRRFHQNLVSSSSQFAQRVGRPPLESELAADMNIPLKKYRQLEFATRAAKLVSLDAYPNEGANRFTIPSVPIEARLLHVRIADAARSLPEPERAVIEAMCCGRSLHEIALKLRVSDSRVSQIKSNAIVGLRVALRISPPALAPQRRRAS